MKLADIDLSTVKQYLRVDDDDDDKLIEIMFQSAKAFVSDYTGQTLADLGEYEDVVLVVLSIVGEMYDNRTVSVNDKLNVRVNELVSQLIGRHSINLL